MGNYKNYHLVISKFILACFDYIGIVLGILSAYYLRLSFTYIPLQSNFKMEDIYVYAVIPAIFLFVLLLNNAYSVAAPYWDTIKAIFRSITISVVVSIVLMYTGHVTNDVSRLFVGFAYICILLFVYLFRFFIGKALSYLGYLNIPVLLVGAGKTAELVKKAFDRMPISTYKIIGFVDDNPKSASIAAEYECLGTFDDVEDVIKDTGVQTVLICAPGLESKKLVSLVNRLQLLVKRVAFVPELFGLPASNISARGMMEEQAVVLRVQNNLARKSNRIMKRIFDIMATVCGGILILPIIAVVAVLIYLDSPGPIVFGHKRVGQGGKEFFCYKFRSMVPNAQEALAIYLKEHPEAREEWERDFKLKDDPRVTKIGKFLRKTSLDELPQLWNVLMGDMSLVGPRPIVRDEIVKYGDYINDFYLVPPGITGVWQVSGRSDTTYEERVLMDSWYVHNWSVWIDVVYLIKTVLAVVKGKGAY
ncbi:undecaprenyl-phosphate galactose phosphotransferase WbaP [Veillonella sp. AS16]|uniref:undecaprenyl-phosphate galactose phosphotransferase WbaP n=1 Tax=Veillonella sp. AS16 TaxID=936589 RepID=UPI0003E27A73|nr:undecaprenyl-phosphate galactose phosphotransferase WbaP [Veillonella sp. AS16]ETS92139.1 undecaprenyl-phosphate galactose phosphotransferase WbaP [Veillonella sp. AS16]